MTRINDSWLVIIILVHRQFETEIEVHQAVPRAEQELRLDLEELQDDKNIILIQTFAAKKLFDQFHSEIFICLEIFEASFILSGLK